MKVLILAFEYLPIVGGGSSYTHSLVTGLSKAAQVFLLTSGEKGEEIRRKNLLIRRFRTFNELYQGKGNLVTAVKILNQQIKDLEPDIIQTHHSLETLIGKIANVNFGLPHIIVPLKTPRYKQEHYKINAKWSLYSFVNQDTENNEFVALSRAYKNCLLSFGVSPENINLIYPGIDCSFFKKLPPGERDLFRKKLGVSKSEILILVPTKIRKRKGLEFLTDSLAGFSFGSKKIKLLITGLGERGVEEKQKTRIKKALFPLELLIPQEFPPEQMPVLYNAADLTVFPSEAEGFGLAALEAISCGCPVVSAAVKGVNEIVQNEQNGLLVPFGNKQKLRNAIRKMLVNQDLRKKCIRGGFLTIKERFSLERQTREYLALYHQLISQRKQSAGGVVYRIRNGSLQIYLAKHQEYGFVLPKGGKEPGETWLETAIREVREETGFSFKSFSYYLGKIAYSFEKEGKTYRKQVRFFAFEKNEKIKEGNLSLEKGEKIKKGKWFPVKKAISQAVHQSEKEMIQKLEKILKNENRKG